jgi:hypothetical protein
VLNAGPVVRLDRGQETAEAREHRLVRLQPVTQLANHRFGIAIEAGFDDLDRVAYDVAEADHGQQEPGREGSHV